MSTCKLRWLPPPDPLSKVARIASRLLRSNFRNRWVMRVVVDKHTGELVSLRAVRPTSQQDQAEESGTQNPSPDEAAKADGAGVEDPPPPEAVPPEIRDAVSDAELQDLQAVAEQYGMTLQEAFDRYAWNDNFFPGGLESSGSGPRNVCGSGDR